MLINYRRQSRDKVTERYIRSLNPVLYLPLWKRDGSTFLSDDGSGLLCTVTGAVRTGQGRQFDGDDWISIGQPAPITSLSKGTILTWVKLTSLTDDAVLWRWGGSDVAAPGYFAAYIELQGGNYYVAIVKKSDVPGTEPNVRGGTTLVAGQMYLVETGSDGTAYYIRVNGIPETITVITAPNNGDWFADTAFASPQNIGIGAGYYDGAIVGYLQGIIGEQVWLPRELSLSESREFYERTKWRYK